MMKTKYIFTSLLLSSLAVTGCQDMDLTPDGGLVTDAQKETIAQQDPSKAKAGVNAIFATFSQYMPNAGALGYSRHNDIGYPTIMLCLDANTADNVSDNNGYNWTGYDLTFEDRQNTNLECQMVWNDLYSIIYASNTVAATYSEDTTDPDEQFYLAQGLAARGFAYSVLAQLYQFTYIDSKDKPCVPIITDKNSADAAVNGCPRSTVAKVYEQIESDLTKAINLLTAAKVKRDDKRYISLGVAYGLRARMYLVMQDYAKAVSDAQEAIANSTSEGIMIAEATDINKPAFWTMDETNWMWGIKVNETDGVVDSGIVNWISHMGSLNYGYANYSGGRQISTKLYAEIDKDDVRKGWWLDATASSANLNEEQADFMATYGYAPYTQVKFAPYKNSVGTSINANDMPLMRIEEMYLIIAEAGAMSGSNRAAGQTAFTTFIQNRFLDGTSTGTYLTKYNSDPQEAVYTQRRIELWGEGLIWFDIMRLKKGVDRRNCGFPNAECIFNIAADDDILLWRIPEAEIQANKALTTADSPAWTLPKPVAEN